MSIGHEEPQGTADYLPEPLRRPAERLDTAPRVLVVDDKAHNRQLLWAILVPEGYEVMEAADGETAIEILTHKRVDLVLLDVMLPGMDGIETCRVIRRKLGMLALPVIFVTALSDRLSRLRGQAAGGDEFLSKPIDEVELLLRVRTLLRAKAYHDGRELRSAQLSTELESLRDQLVHVERLATLGTLAGGVGHELNNVLTVFLGTLHFLRERTAQGLPARERDVEQRGRVAEHIATHARHLLSLARPGPDFAERVNLCEIIESTARMLTLSGRTRQVGVRLDLPDSALWVSVNRVRIEQVLVNLIANAADAVHEAQRGRAMLEAVPDGTILISAGRLGAGRVRCSVVDNGTGIPADRLSDIFQAYYTTKPPESGTGLGLPVVKRIVESYSGSLTVASEMGRGSTFSFDLPLDEEPVQ